MAPRVDFELAALRAGLKPALRISADAAEVPAIASRLREAGAQVVVAHGYLHTERRERAILYAAREPGRAEALRDAEAPTFRKPAPPVRELVEGLRRTGALLGYPRCCVEEYVRRMEASLAPGGGGRTAPSDAYRDAVASWVASPHPLLNTWIRALQPAPVSHEPCRLDCAESVAYATACLELAARRDPDGARAAGHALATPVVIAPSGARALARLQRGSPPRVEAARPLGEGQADAALARAVVGAEIRTRGALGARAAPGALLLDFGAAGDPVWR